MKKQVVKVSVGQSAKVVAVLYLLISIPIVLLVALFAMASGQWPILLALVLAPLFYAGAAFLGTAFSAWLYNVAAAKVGGLEYTTAEVGEAH